MYSTFVCKFCGFFLSLLQVNGKNGAQRHVNCLYSYFHTMYDKNVGFHSKNHIKIRLNHINPVFMSYIVQKHESKLFL